MTILADTNAVVEIIREVYTVAVELGFRTWQIVALVAFWMACWAWRGAKVPLVQLGGKKEG